MEILPDYQTILFRLDFYCHQTDSARCHKKKCHKKKTSKIILTAFLSERGKPLILFRILWINYSSMDRCALAKHASKHTYFNQLTYIYNFYGSNLPSQCPQELQNNARYQDGPRFDKPINKAQWHAFIAKLYQFYSLLSVLWTIAPRLANHILKNVPCSYKPRDYILGTWKRPTKLSMHGIINCLLNVIRYEKETKNPNFYRIEFIPTRENWLSGEKPEQKFNQQYF